MFWGLFQIGLLGLFVGMNIKVAFVFVCILVLRGWIMSSLFSIKTIKEVKEQVKGYGLLLFFG